ncbi:alpha/beta fold hydrolase [Microbacterium indicum]|uniref:alpha/beta fold hydrolase n=1 Tax=Microbacterium indicum TaxID=358100 RepID=UPI0004184AEA|nr:alpha/beta fold hydrolase [Microbacterium indicum]
MHGQAITQDGAELFWTARGEGPALLLIAGQASTHRGWLPLVPHLVAERRVVLFDHRGVGQSTMGDADRFTTRSFARDAVAVLDAAGVASADVYGHSMGGRVAQWMAIDRPERVDRLVLAGSTGGDRFGPARDPDVNRVLSSGDPAQMAPLFFTESFRERHPEAVAGFFARDAGIRARRAHFDASRRHDAWDELHRISSPTLVIHGSDDPVTPVESARLLAARIPDAVLDVVPGQRHCPHLESAEARARVDAFLAHPS